MRFINKSKEPPMSDSRQSIFDASTDNFFDFIGGVLDTEDPEAIRRLTELGYESITDGKSESIKCDKCEFVAKNRTGFVAHSRSHKEKQ